MSDIQKTFQRIELKYRINESQQKELLAALKPLMHKDERGSATVCNLYFDTPDMLLIRRSIEKPIYKEKLRVRSYGRVQEDGAVFVGLKKKYKKVVYKRRAVMTEKEAMAYLRKEMHPKEDTQILREIDYFLDFYQNLAPRMYIAYDRFALYGNEDSDLRITFDSNLLWRTENLSLTSEIYGNSLLPKGEMIMEIKIPSAMPLWLCHLLNSMGIYKTSFSKYGTAYKCLTQEQNKGRYDCA